MARLAWLQTVDDADLHLASVTLGDIQAGIERTREQDSAKAAEIQRWWHPSESQELCEALNDAGLA